MLKKANNNLRLRNLYVSSLADQTLAKCGNFMFRLTGDLE